MSTKLKNGQSRYQSKAKVVTIKKFQLLTLVKATRCLNDAEFEKYGDACLEFPIIVQGDGQPSEIFNLYLMKKLQQTIQYDFKTFASIANQLLDFQRFYYYSYEKKKYRVRLFKMNINYYSKDR